MLITNLFNNAIKHNIEGGTLKVVLESNELIFENTGEPLKDEPELYFDRFKKGSAAADSSGLGLSLIKKICDIYGMSIKYSNTKELHTITIIF